MSSIRLKTKLRLYQTYIVPVLMYGCETWATTKYLLSRLDAFDTWALRKILRIAQAYTRHVSNAEVRGVTGCSPLSHLVTNRRLRLFGHIARSDQQEDLATLGSVQLRQTLASELWPRDCLEKGNYSRRMATYCGHSNAPAEYSLKEETGISPLAIFFTKFGGRRNSQVQGLFQACSPTNLCSPRCNLCSPK